MPTDLSDRVVSLDNLSDGSVRSVGERLQESSNQEAMWSILDELIARRLATSEADDPELTYVLTQLAAGHRVQVLADELGWSTQMVMLSSAQPTAFALAAPMRTVAEAGGNTQSLYVVVDDVDAHCDQARAGGADIYMEPADNDYGGRSYGARDLEGNAWSFGKL